jgi:hypothetical protein
LDGKENLELCHKETTTTAAVDISSRFTMVEDMEDDDLILGSDDDWTDCSPTEETSSTQGTSVSEMMTHDSDNIDVMEEGINAAVGAVAYGEDFTMEVEEEEPSNGVVVEATTVADATDDKDADTDDVLDLEKLYDLLEQSKRAVDLIAGKNVMLLIGCTGAGKVSFLLSFGL